MRASCFKFISAYLYLLFYSSMFLGIYTLFATVVFSQESSTSYTDNLIDYETLDHEITITKIRAGNHDQEGINQYYFKVDLIGLINQTDEKKLEFENKKKIIYPLGSFCQINLPALSYWQPDLKKETTKYKFEIKGYSIRALVAKMMNQFNIKENEIAIRINIEMWEGNKKYFLLENDKQIAKIFYFPLPYTPSEQKPRLNRKLIINDGFGTQVNISIDYKQPYIETNQSEG